MTATTPANLATFLHSIADGRRGHKDWQTEAAQQRIALLACTGDLFQAADDGGDFAMHGPAFHDAMRGEVALTLATAAERKDAHAAAMLELASEWLTPVGAYRIPRIAVRTIAARERAKDGDE